MSSCRRAPAVSVVPALGSLPKVIVPSVSAETRRPERPSWRYSMGGTLAQPLVKRQLDVKSSAAKRKSLLRPSSHAAPALRAWGESRPWQTAPTRLTIAASEAAPERSAAGQPCDQRALVRAEPGRPAGRGVLADALHARGGRDGHGAARVRQRPLEQ